VAAQAGGGLLNLILKSTFERTRPEFSDPLLAASSWSFPSGHAMGTFILCGLGCYLVIRELRSWAAVGVVLCVSALWCVLMGFSRLYLGVHFASDVIAGLIAGTAWVAVCVSALEAIRRRGDTAGNNAGRTHH
jgi:undecaprenyl-diphosphatase